VRRAVTLALALGAALGGCASAQTATPAAQQPAAQQAAAAPNTLTAAERAAGWRLLFDGRTTQGWRGYMRDTMPSGWAVVDGALTRVARTRDIMTVDQFEDFELVLEWRLDPAQQGGNSGIFYRAIEGPPQIYFSAPEMQILDDATHPDGRSPLTSTGSNYGLDAPPPGLVKPLGEWNTVRIVIDDDRVQHWLNGVKAVEYVLGSPEWTAKVAKSKFAQWPEYGKAARGHIGLQEHGSRVAFRNIKIRELP
jgi:uncharacterized protein YceK